MKRVRVAATHLFCTSLYRGPLRLTQPPALQVMPAARKMLLNVVGIFFVHLPSANGGGGGVLIAAKLMTCSPHRRLHRQPKSCCVEDMPLPKGLYPVTGHEYPKYGSTNVYLDCIPA